MRHCDTLLHAACIVTQDARRRVIENATLAIDKGLVADVGPTAELADRWLSMDEISAYLGVSTDTISKWIEKSEMPAHRLGKLWKFKASEVDAWVRSGKAAK